MKKYVKIINIVCIIIILTTLLTFFGVKVNREIRYQKIVDAFEETFEERIGKTIEETNIKEYSTYSVVKDENGKNRLFVEIYFVYEYGWVTCGKYLEGAGNMDTRYFEWVTIDRRTFNG